MSSLEYDVEIELTGKEQATAWLDTKVEELRILAKEPPPHLLALGEPGVKKWKSLFLMKYGKTIGSLETMATFGIMPVEEVKEYERRVKFMLTGNLGLVVVGNQK